MPRVSVVMTTFNNVEFLAEAVASILGQTFEDFEFLIVDDASTDATPRLLREIDDPRVTILTNDANIGIPASAQRALRRVSGEYVARMDSDDVSVPDRLARQVAFLDAHEDVGVVGGQRMLIDDGGTVYQSPIRVKTTHNLIVWSVFLGASFWHSSTMIRRPLLERASGYNVQYRYASDLELWTRLMFFCRFANLDETLIHYRIHERNTSQLWRQLPAPPPPRTNLASRLTDMSVPRDRFNRITNIIYANGRVSAADAHELSVFLVRLYTGLVDAGVLIDDRTDIAAELTRNIARIHAQSPETVVGAYRTVVAATLGPPLRRLRRDRRPDPMQRFIRDRSQGNRPLL